MGTGNFRDVRMWCCQCGAVTQRLEMVGVGMAAVCSNECRDQARGTADGEAQT